MDQPERPSESALRAAFAPAPVGVVITTDDGTLRWGNAAMAELLGLPDDGLTGRDLRDLVWHEDQLGAWVEFRRLLAGEADRVRLEVRFVVASGTLVRTLATAYRVEGAEPPLVITHVIDITARERHEQELQTHERMRTVGRLASTIAHDFNNLLTAIQTNTSLAADAVDAPEVREMLDDVLAAAEAGARLTNRLLGFSSGATPRSECVNLAGLVADRHPALRSIAPGKRVEVEASGPAWVMGDSQQIEQVLLNLLANARDASTVWVRVGVDGPDVTLDVEDDGPGMPEEVRARAFEPFYTTRQAEGGRGLGLTTVYGIVTRFAGTVRIDSAPGEGTTVRIRLPATDAPHGSSEGLDSIGIDPRGRYVALVVDDDATVRRGIARVLRTSGCEVLEADGVRTARARLARHGDRLSLLVADVVLQDGNGADLAREVTERHPRVRTLFVTGYDPAILQPDAPVRLEPLLRKPFTNDDVLAAAIKLLA